MKRTGHAIVCVGLVGVLLGPCLRRAEAAGGSIVGWGNHAVGGDMSGSFVAVAAGPSHSLGLKADGSIVGWGADSYGPCNAPAPNTDFVAVAGGGHYSLGLRPGIRIWSVASMADHGLAGEIGLYVDLTASTLPADSALVTTESREEGITKLMIDCDGDVTLPDPPENLVSSIIGVNNGDVTANVASVTAVADMVTINLTALPDQDTYTVTLAPDVIAGDNDFMIRALKGEVNNAGGGAGGSQVVNALDLSLVRTKFTADVTVVHNAKYDIVSDSRIDGLDLFYCGVRLAHTAP